MRYINEVVKLQNNSKLCASNQNTTNNCPVCAQIRLPPLLPPSNHQSEYQRRRHRTVLLFTHLIGIVCQPVHNPTLLLTLGGRTDGSIGSSDEGFTCDGVHHGAADESLCSIILCSFDSLLCSARSYCRYFYFAVCCMDTIVAENGSTVPGSNQQLSVGRLYSLQ